MGILRDHIVKTGGDPSSVQLLTKWVPRPADSFTLEEVRQAIGASLERMKTDSVDMIQFHWWDYSNEAYLDALKHLKTLHEEGVIKHLALTNFDTIRLKKIVDEAGIPITSNQVSYSIIDRRPEDAMIPYCKEKGIYLLTYGTLLGGFLSEKYVDAPEPTKQELTTSSLKKYHGFIRDFGGWRLFQGVLKAVHKVAQKHGVSVANVAW
jgi:aryl-alcohol dehydrogenase-like predicted oxidoreductase